MMDRKIQASVFSVNMDSPKKYHVIIGKTRYETPKAINLTAHKDSLAALYSTLVA